MFILGGKGESVTESRARTSGVLIMFYFLVWLLFARVCSLCENSLSCPLIIYSSLLGNLMCGGSDFPQGWRRGIITCRNQNLGGFPEHGRNIQAPFSLAISFYCLDPISPAVFPHVRLAEVVVVPCLVSQAALTSFLPDLHRDRWCKWEQGADGARTVFLYSGLVSKLEIMLILSSRNVIVNFSSNCDWRKGSSFEFCALIMDKNTFPGTNLLYIEKLFLIE